MRVVEAGVVIIKKSKHCNNLIAPGEAHHG